MKNVFQQTCLLLAFFFTYSNSDHVLHSRLNDIYSQVVILDTGEN